jgi:hypothetical protein
MNRQLSCAAVALLLVLPLTISHGQQPSPAAPDRPPFVPGLGEFMLATQGRHAKLWLAGNAQNWDLADYQIDELKEGLEDAAKYVPWLKGLPVGKMIESTMEVPIAELEKVIKAKDRNRFAAAFDKVTEACNSCHQAASRPFITVQRPTSSTYSNQSFAPTRR